MSQTIPPRAVDNLLQEAEETALARELRDSVDNTGVRTIDSDIQRGKHSIYGPIRSVLLRETRTQLIHDLRGLPRPEGKVKSLWEAHLPQPLDGDAASAADFVLQEPTMNWGMFLNDPLMEKALVDDVVHSLLEDLSYAASHVKNAAGNPEYTASRKQYVKEARQKNGQTPTPAELEAKCGKESPLQTWKRRCPAVYSQAESAIDDWVDIAYRKEQNHPLAEEAVGAIKTTKMMACCLLHAHLIGSVEFDADDSPVGQGHQSLRLKSPVLAKIQEKGRGQGSGGYEWRMLFAKYNQVNVGTVKKIEFGQGNPDDVGRLQEVFETNGDPYEKMFDLLISEMNPRSKFFSENRTKWTPEHSVDQVSKALSPVLAMDPQKMRQKKMDPLVVFGLYSLASELEVITRKNVYPLIGHDDLPQKMPPNFRLRVPLDEMEERGWSVGSLANAGFNPLVHERFEDVTLQVMGKLPEMKQKLMDKGILRFLKQAHTDQVILAPIKQEILQDELRKGYKFLDPEGYSSIVVQAYKDADPQRYGNLTVRDLTERTKAAHIPTPKLRAEVLHNVFKDVVQRVSHMPRAVEKLEGFLMQDRNVTVHHLCVDPKLQGKFPLQPHPLVPKPDPSRLPDNGRLVQFQSETVAYNERHKLDGVFLSDLHFKSVAQASGKGVLPSWSVAMQSLFSTYDKDTVATAYGHHNVLAKESLMGVTNEYVDEAREVGIMGFPYFHRAGTAARPDNTGDLNYSNECRVKGIPMLRIRNQSKNKDVPKYATPNFRKLKALGDRTPVREVPAYISPHYVSNDAADVLKEFLVEAAVVQAGGDMRDSEVVANASAAIDAAGFTNYYKQPLDNTDIPLYCIEGEKKSQAVESIQQLQMVERAKEVLLAGDPAKALERVKPVDFRAVVGMVGVWITARKPQSRDHVMRPEFVETINLQDRDITLMYDGDGHQPGSETNNHQVLGASVTSAHVLARDFNAKPHHWRPPEGPGKGADDWLEEHAKRLDKSMPWEQRVYQSYLDLEVDFMAQKQPLKTNLSFKDVTDAQKAGKKLDEFVTGTSPRESVPR